MLAAALIALDLLPFYAVLLVAAGDTTRDVGRVALPFTYLAATSATFALVGRVLRRLPVLVSILVGILVGTPLFVMALAVSPAAYGDTPGGLLGGNWINTVLSDVSTGVAPVNVYIVLGVIVLALGFRGIALGREPPELDSVLNLLKVSLVVIVVTAILATGLAPGVRTQAEAALGFLLPLDVFAGLIASALSRAALNREELRGADPRTLGGERWLAMAIVLSGAVVVVTLIISSIVTFGSVTTALHHLGPVGDALNTAISAVVEGFAFLLFLVLGPLIDWLHQKTSQVPPQPPATPQGPPQTKPNPPLHSLLPDQWVRIAEIFLLVCLVLLVVLVAIMVLRMLLGERRHASDGIPEERESLDGRSLLGAQLRGLLDRFRRHSDGEPEEALPAGSVRALYRELLRAAAGHGIARRAPETPDEYSRRLGNALGTSGGGVDAPADVAVLSEAYDAARYGEREPAEGERRTLRERSAEVLQTLKRRPG